METIISLFKTDSETLYETDYLKWIEVNLQKLRDRDYANVDWENLLEEIEDMGKSERRSIESNLIVVLLHLLKWQFQPERRSSSWESSIVEHRRRIREALKDSPSLKSYFETVLAECYGDAVKQAKVETNLPLTTFPVECPYHLTEVIDDDFLPDREIEIEGEIS